MPYVTSLTELDIEFGKELWQALRRDKTLPWLGVLWLLESESSDWHLLVASPRVDEVGPRKAYEELAQVTRRMAANDPQLLKIELISPKGSFYRALRNIFGNAASVEGTRLGNTQVEGMYIEDAYLYEIR